jgi:hypothetical protein
VQAIFGSRGLCPQLLARSLPITTITMARVDRASQVLAQSLLDDVPRTYAARAEQSNVPLSTLHHRAKGRRSREEKAQSQQYLGPEEEKAVARFLLLMSIPPCLFATVYTSTQLSGSKRKPRRQQIRLSPQHVNQGIECAVWQFLRPDGRIAKMQLTDRAC